MIATSYHDTINVLQGTIAPSPFERAEWFALLVQSGQKPFIATTQTDGRLAALALTRANGRIEPLANWYSLAWRPLADADDNEALVAMARSLRSETHRVTLWPIPDEDGSATRTERAFAKAGWSVRREQCDHNHVLPVNGRSFAEYWASRPGRMRTTLKRKAKKVEVEILSHFDAVAWAKYEAIYNSSWKPEEGDPVMLRAFAKQEGLAGRLRLGIARHEGMAVAAQFWTVENGTAYIHKLAHREDTKRLSAGTVLSAALFEKAIDEDRVALVDFGTGNDPYKTDWMEEARPRFRIDCLDPRQPKAWPALAKRGFARVAPTRGDS